MNKRHSFLLLLLTAFFFYSPVTAQYNFSDFFSLTHFTTNTGLPDNRLRQLIEDQDGCLLVVTIDKGIYRFDGLQFAPLKINEQLPSLFIQTVIKDKNDRLWIACNYSGIWIYDHGQLYPFKHNDLFKKQHFVTMYCDNKNNIWIYVNKIGLFRFDGISCENMTHKYQLFEENIIHIQQKNNETLYLLFDKKGLYKLSLTANKNLTPVFEKKRIINSFLKKKNGDIIVKHNFLTIAKFSNNKQSIIFQNKSKQKFIYPNILFEDRVENLWFTSKDAIYCYHENQLDSISAKNIGESYPFQDRFGNLWFATDNGLFKLVQANVKCWHFSEPNGQKKSTEITTHFLYQDKKGTLWFTDDDFCIHYFNNDKIHRFSLPDSLSHVKITKMIQDDSGNYYLATFGKGIYCWNGKTFKNVIPSKNLPGAYITSLYIDANNKLWLGAISSLLHFSSPKTKLNEFISNLKEKRFSHNFTITCMFIDENENIWLGSAGNKLFKSSNGKFEKKVSLALGAGDIINVQNLISVNDKIWGSNIRGLFNYNLINNEYNIYKTPIYDTEIWNKVLSNHLEFFTGDYSYNFSLFQLEKFKNYKRNTNHAIYNISTILENVDGLWIGSYSVGLFFINKDTLIHFNYKYNLPSLKISCLLKDRNNTIWVGTLDNGLFQIVDFHVEQPDIFKEIGTSIASIFEDSNGTIWVGTLDNGLIKINSDKITSFATDLPIMGIGESTAANVYIIYENANFGQVINDSIKFYPREAVLINSDLRDAFRNRTLNFRKYFIEPEKYISSGLICWDGDKIFKYTVEDGLPSHEITDIAETADNRLWVATFNAGVAFFNGDRFLSINSAELKRLNRFTTLKATSDSALWVLTDGDGIACIKGKTAKVWSAGSSVITAPIHDFQVDQNNQLVLLSSYNNFYFFDDGNIQPIPGLQQLQNLPRIADFFNIDEENSIWFISSDQKLYRFFPDSTPPIIKIKFCQIGNDSYSESNFNQPIIQKYDHKVCAIDIMGYHSSFPPQSLKYSHRVIEDDVASKWSEFSSQPRLFYSDLQPGKKHLFEFRAKTPNSLISNSPAKLIIQLKATPIYFRIEFILLIVLISFAVVSGFYIHRLRSIKQIIMRRRFNPYIAGEPIFNENLFFGRAKVITAILSIIHNNSIMITGERRIGKTSLLIQIRKQLQNANDPYYLFMPIFIDLQGISQWEFFRAIIHDIIEQNEEIAQLKKLRVREKMTNYNYRDFSSDFRKIITHLSSQNNKLVKLILLIDEADAMNEFDQKIHAQLRRIFMQDFSTHFAAIISGTDYLKKWNRPESPWWNLFHQIKLTPLDRDEATKLIQKPVRGIFKFKEDALETIIDYTNCKPYLVQQLCIKLVNHALDKRRRTIFLEDVIYLVEQNG